MNDALRFGMMNQHMKVSNKFNQRDEFMMNMIQSTKVMPRGLSAVHSVCVCVCVWLSSRHHTYRLETLINLMCNDNVMLCF